MARNWNGSSWIRKDKRLAIYLRDGFQCFVCGKDLHGTDPFDVTLDHVKPVEKGGTNEATNLITCCRSCNSSRQDKAMSRFVTKKVLKRIHRHRRLSIRKFRKMAKAILAGELAHPAY